MEERLKDFSEKLAAAEKRKNIVAQTIDIKRNNIEIEAKTIEHLEKYGRRQGFIIDMYENVPKAQIMNMNDAEYTNFAAPLNSSGVSGEVAVNIHGESVGAQYLWAQHRDVSASLDPLASADATNLEYVADLNPSWFPHAKGVVDSYRIDDEMEKHIESIRSNLKGVFPNIYDDFEAFVMKFRAVVPDTSQYQDLIGARSMFFWKMIFGFSEKEYGVEGRRKQIETFVFGTATPLASAKGIIDTCFDIWGKLSNQDASGMSVKVGVGDVAYLQGLFRRLIASIAAILDLRKNYFQP